MRRRNSVRGNEKSIETATEEWQDNFVDDTVGEVSLVSFRYRNSSVFSVKV